ncbi:hypothetical protein ACET3X_003735 [Alternaria dauci]|uniref:Ankyrin n=1 Tax=Alternaria dauci TaxID=48095 RepID=A0ABR3UMS3_9PLEO
MSLTTNMKLLDLPPEVFQRIVGVLVKKHGLMAAWKVRGTSKAFKSYITYEVLATPSLYAYNKTRAGREILKHKLADFLYTRSIKLNGFVRAHVPEFIRDVMRAMEPWITGDEAASTLRRTLCRLFVRNYYDALKVVLTDVTKLHINHLNVIVASDKVNLIAAAAVTGNIEALRATAARSRNSLWTKSPAFGYPLDVALYAKNFDIVKAIAQQAITDQNETIINLDQDRRPEAEHLSFRQAICTCIELQRRDMFAYLLEKYVDAFGLPREACMADWLNKAVTYGRKYMLCLLIRFPNQAGISTSYKAFETACRLSKVSLLELFFTSVPTSPARLSVNQVYQSTNGPYSSTYPLMTAIQFAKPQHRRCIVKKLLELGADPNGPKYLAGLARPLQFGMYFDYANSILPLLEAGANPRLINDAGWTKAQRSKYGKVTVIGKALRVALKSHKKFKPTKGVKNFLAEVE